MPPSSRLIHDCTSRRAGRTAFVARTQAALALVLVLCLMLPLSGCIDRNLGNSSDAVSLWAAGPSEWIRGSDSARTESDFYSQTRNQLEISGAVNEIVQWQMALSSDRAASIIPEFSALTGTAGTLPPEAFKAWVERSVRISPVSASYLRRYGGTPTLDVPDILIPLSAPSLAGGVPVNPPAATVLWAEYAIPRTALPGEYHGTLTLRFSGSTNAARWPAAPAQPQRQVAVNLTVHPFAISSARHLSIVAGVDAQRLVTAMMPRATGAAAMLTSRTGDSSQQSAIKLVHDACRLLHENRLEPCLRGVYPPMRFAADGSVELTWPAYDALAGPLIDGRAYADGEAPRYWPLPLDRSRPSPEAMGGLDSPEYARVLREYLAAAQAHFQSRGWADRTCVDLTVPVADLPRPADYESARRLGMIARLADPKLRNIVNLLPVSMSSYGWPDSAWSDLSEVADIWAPPAQFFASQKLRQSRRLGARSWLLPDQPEFAGSVTLGSTPIDVRAMGWHAWSQESDIWLPNSTDAPADLGISHPVPFNPDATSLIYPGSVAGVEGVLPSLRLKQLLRAEQDFEYLWLLKQNDREATAHLIAESMVKATGIDATVDNYADPAGFECVLEPETWELARRVMAEELAVAVSGRPAARERFEQRLNWGRLANLTRGVLLWSDGVRWSDVPSQGAPGWLVEFHVAVENQKWQPIRGDLSFGPLPPGWHAVTDHVQVGPLPERGRGRYKLVARAAGWPVSLDGHLEQPIRLVLDSGETVQTVGISAMVQVPRFSHPPQIDGRLDDWELGRGNVAGDFFGIAPGIHPGSSAAQRRRTGDATATYVARDADSLYIGIRCQAGSAASTGQHDNRVNYDGLVPVGEELVEVLIDPANSAADSSDLYHLVFWRHGAWRAERGVDTRRPIGAVHAWAPDVRYATNVASGVWTVEARIPLNSFGTLPRAGSIWGVNFTRYSVSAGQYSNWSGAIRYCYNPRSLGNLGFGE